MPVLKFVLGGPRSNEVIVHSHLMPVVFNTVHTSNTLVNKTRGWCAAETSLSLTGIRGPLFVTSTERSGATPSKSRTHLRLACNTNNLNTGKLKP